MHLLSRARRQEMTRSILCLALLSRVLIAIGLSCGYGTGKVISRADSAQATPMEKSASPYPQLTVRPGTQGVITGLAGASSAQPMAASESAQTTSEIEGGGRTPSLRVRVPDLTEPSTLTLFGASLLVLAALLRRKVSR
jgi:hypothetical protein